MSDTHPRLGPVLTPRPSSPAHSLDLDDSGQIDIEELKKGVGALGLSSHISMGELVALMRFLDRDGNGTISFYELHKELLARGSNDNVRVNLNNRGGPLKEADPMLRLAALVKDGKRKLQSSRVQQTRTLFTQNRSAQETNGAKASIVDEQRLLQMRATQMRARGREGKVKFNETLGGRVRTTGANSSQRVQGNKTPAFLSHLPSVDRGSPSFFLGGGGGGGGGGSSSNSSSQLGSSSSGSTLRPTLLGQHGSTGSAGLQGTMSSSEARNASAFDGSQSISKFRQQKNRAAAFRQCHLNYDAETNLGSYYTSADAMAEAGLG